MGIKLFYDNVRGRHIVPAILTTKDTFIAMKIRRKWLTWHERLNQTTSEHVDRGGSSEESSEKMRRKKQKDQQDKPEEKE